MITCLDTQAFESEAREATAENNLLATGQVSADDVKHEMKPVIAGVQWFIRFYFVELPTDVAMFISVHKSKFPRT